MAELHIVGQILGGVDFSSPTVFCKWGIHTGRGWELLEGLEGGQTQVDLSAENEMAVWAHPIDVHYACRGLTGWPKLHFQVWSLDDAGKNDVCGYGFCHVPAAPGMYEIDCPTWAPEGSMAERITSFFVGGAPRMKVDEVVYSPEDRFRLQTVTSGTVKLQLGVVMKDFDRNHVHTG